LNEELRRFGEAALILLGVDAIHRAGLHAQFILGTGIGNYVCHDGSMCNSAASANWKKTGGETQQPPAIGWGKARKRRRLRAAGGYPAPSFSSVA
jgi:anaerobic selenocysteine-containing dehydrogenase